MKYTATQKTRTRIKCKTQRCKKKRLNSNVTLTTIWFTTEHSKVILNNSCFWNYVCSLAYRSKHK